MALNKYNLGPAPQRCVAHMNDEAAAGRAERPRLAVRIGIALGPAVVGFFGMNGRQPDEGLLSFSFSNSHLYGKPK